jgi:SAM-dependent methyltransferase
MIATDRLRREQSFHDEQASSRARTFASDPDRLQFSDDEYLNHEPWVRPAIERLGNLDGRRVLDWGCGHGMAAVVMARQGGRVTACDLSAGYVSEARSRAAANGVEVDVLQADAHRLPFQTGAFHAIWGHAILHHLDVPTAAEELRRVLHPDGIAVVCEPWDGSPLVRAVRRWLAHSGRRTSDERPLGERDIEALRLAFRTVQLLPYQAIFPSRLGVAIQQLDRRIMSFWPALRRFCRYVVIELRL